MFDRFTHDARAVVVLADEEARHLGHDWIGTEHLLVALSAAPGTAGEVLAAGGVTPADLRRELRRETGRRGGLDADALRGLGIDLDEVRRSVDDTFGPGAFDEAGARTPRRRFRAGKARFTRRAKVSLSHAVRRSVSLGSGAIGTEHLLLGVLEDPDGLAVVLLENLDADCGALRQATLDRIRRSA